MKSLDAFLAAPDKLAPGTTMLVAVPDAAERADLIAFLATTEAPPGVAEPKPVASVMPEPAPARALAGRGSFGGYRDDGPGVRRHITAANLPAPLASPSSRNPPLIVLAPSAASLHVPPGFAVSPFLENLVGPRLLRVAPNGDIFVAESSAGRIRALRAKDGAPHPDENEAFATGLDRPFGLAFYPPGEHPKWLYVAQNDSVVRFSYRPGDLHASAAPEVVVPKLTGSSGGHWTRDIAFSRDGASMFVSVGSASNVAEKMPHRTVSEAADWERLHGLGAAWGDEENRADVLVFDPQGGHLKVFASGIRNCVGLTTEPKTGELWCSTNERDGLGDDLVPDYITRVKAGAFYGWPWYYLGPHEDPRRKGERPDLAAKVAMPDVLLQPHSASLQLSFYTGHMFPEEMRGDGFAALHGSWNRATRTGYKVVRVRMKGGVPTGEYEDFLTGFVIDDDHVWGRPVGVAIARDGALLVSEDGNGSIWRVTYGAAATTPGDGGAPQH